MKNALVKEIGCFKSVLQSVWALSDDDYKYVRSVLMLYRLVHSLSSNRLVIINSMALLDQLKGDLSLDLYY